MLKMFMAVVLAATTRSSSQLAQTPQQKMEIESAAHGLAAVLGCRCQKRNFSEVSRAVENYLPKQNNEAWVRSRVYTQ